MTLELTPEVENIVRERAATEGVSVNDLLARAFAPAPQSTPQASPPITDPKAHVQALIAKRQADDQTPQYPPIPIQPGETPLGALFREWEEEDAQLSEEEKKPQSNYGKDTNKALMKLDGSWG